MPATVLALPVLGISRSLLVQASGQVRLSRHPVIATLSDPSEGDLGFAKRGGEMDVEGRGP